MSRTGSMDAVEAGPAEQPLPDGSGRPRASVPLPRRGLGFVLAVLAITTLLAAASAPSPFYPQLQREMGMPPVGISLVFAVYALALLVTLLTVGSLSDNVGRRPVVTVGFLLLAGGMLLLWHADTAAVLFAARAVQGIASGILLSALAASVTDFAPPTRPRLAPLLNAVAPMAGLALGSVFAGLALRYTADALALVFGVLAAVYVAIAALVWAVPETAARLPGWAKALRPRAVVPASARRMFLVSVPIIIAGWATGGLFFSLGPDIIIRQLDMTGPLAQALTIAVLPAAGGLAVLVLHGRTPRAAVVYGAAALAVGTPLTLVALASGSAWGYLAAVAVTGTGFGTAFMGVLGSLTPTVALHQRAELFAAVYTVSYLSFGVPTIAAGALVAVAGLATTTLVYGLFVTLCAAGALWLRLRRPASA